MRMFCTCLLVSTNEPLKFFRFFKPMPPHELGLEFGLGLEAKKPGLSLVGLGLGLVGLVVASLTTLLCLTLGVM